MPDRVISVPQATQIAQRIKNKFDNINGRLHEQESALYEDVEGVHTYAYSDLTWTGAYITGAGAESAHAAYKTSDYLPVVPDDNVEYDGLRSPTSNTIIVAAYDENHDFISGSSVNGSGAKDSGTYTVPAGVAYIRVVTFNYNGENYFEFVKIPYTEKVSKLDEMNESITGLGEEQEEQGDRITSLEGAIGSYTETGFDQFDISVSGGISKTGTDWEYANAVRSDYIPTDNIQSVTIHIKGVNKYEAVLASYDASKSFISEKSVILNDLSQTGGNWIFADGTVEIGSDVKFIRITRSTVETTKKDDTITVVKTRDFSTDYADTKSRISDLEADAKSPWKGKKWYAFGTSLTDSTYLDPNGDPTGKYPAYLNQYMQAELINKGKGGGGITSHSNGAILTAIRNTDFSDADLVTLEGFPNDYSAAPGEFTDTTADTLCGALYLALTEIYETAPNATVVLITASQGQLNAQGTSGYPIDFVSATGNYQVEYNEAIIKMGQYFGCHVIDAGGKAQINNFHPQYLVDHIHHSFLGGEQFAKTIWEELKSIRPAVKGV